MTLNRRRSINIFLASVLCAIPGIVSAQNFDCLIEPRQVVEIRPGTQGIIEKVHVERGDAVKRGQVLVSLDSGFEKASADSARYRSEMRGAIRAGESRVKFAAQKHRRREQLGVQKFVSDQEREEAETEKLLADAELVEARENQQAAVYEYRRALEQLRLRTVFSPIDGIVVDRMMNPGELADTSDNRKVILKLADIAVLRVEALLPLRAFGKVETGRAYDVNPEEPIGGTLQATALVIDKVMDPGSGTFSVRFELPNPDLKIPSGIKCRVTIPDI